VPRPAICSYQCAAGLLDAHTEVCMVVADHGHWIRFILLPAESSGPGQGRLPEGEERPRGSEIIQVNDSDSQ